MKLRDMNIDWKAWHARLWYTYNVSLFYSVLYPCYKSIFTGSYADVFICKEKVLILVICVTLYGASEMLMKAVDQENMHDD